MNVGNVWNSKVLAIVNSPSTTVAVRNDDEISALDRLGKITRHTVANQPAPRLRDASTKVRTSMARMPASIARYVNGNASTT